MKKLIIASLLIPSLALAEPTTQEQCQQLLDAYGQIEVKAAQSQLVASVQQGIARSRKGEGAKTGRGKEVK